MANVSKLLHGATGKVDLLANLEPTPVERNRVEEAQGKIRAQIRTVFAQSTKIIGASVSPRFFSQGSYAYKTLNRPAYPPKQQMDLDDGTYLPLSFLKKGAPRPSIAAAAFFKVVDTALISLAKNEGWTFKEKPTCSRLIIATDAHVDVPLYAIADEQFHSLQKAALDAGLLRADQDVNFMEGHLQLADQWRLLPSEAVMLAHREDDWISSDPRKIHAWFLAAVSKYGEQLRRQSRYIKAWRDYHKLSSLCSLAIMAAVFTVYEEKARGSMPARDDEALLEISRRLPSLFSGTIENPADKSERLDRKITDEDRRNAIALATVMTSTLEGIITRTYSADLAISNLRKIFGERVPSRHDLVIIEGEAKKVASIAPTIVAAPEVRRSYSG